VTGIPSAAKIWEQFHDLLFDRLATVEAGVAAYCQEALTPDLRKKAVLESHRLAGTLGMLGLREGTEIAREIERSLTSEAPIDPEQSAHMGELAGKLRQILERGVE
jgi:HPt (histidine-containing phosphotransfer) domain-containing protein